MRLKTQDSRLKVFVLSALLLFSAGCANTVTPLFPPGGNITMDINFKGNINTGDNGYKYYIIFNNNAAPQIPFINTGVQFVEPGITPSQPEVDYYGKIYCTWKSYIVLDGNTFSFVKGPYTSEAVPTKETIAIWNGNETARILLSFNLDKLGTLTERLNFDFVTVDKQSKMAIDNLSLDNKSLSSYYVFTIANSTATGSDEVIGTAEASDITTWRIVIQ